MERVKGTRHDRTFLKPVSDRRMTAFAQQETGRFPLITGHLRGGDDLRLQHFSYLQFALINGSYTHLIAAPVAPYRGLLVH